MKIDTGTMAYSADIAKQYAMEKGEQGAAFAQELADASKQAKAVEDDKKLKAVCKDFEAMYLNMMYQKMRETVPDDPLLGTSNGEKIMQSLLDTEITKNMAEAGGVGLADMLYRQLSLQSRR